MNAEELFVEDAGQRYRIEHLHGQVEGFLVVLG